MQQLQGLHVLILGLGASGLAMARWCARHGADVTVADTREAPPQLPTLQAEWPQAKFVGGPFTAALIEGASQWRIFRSICLPLAMPGVAVSSILSFIFSWNELLFAYILAPKAAKTAPAMAITFMEGYDVPYGKIMATATLIAVPVMVFALIVSRHLVRGLTMGAVK